MAWSLWWTWRCTLEWSSLLCKPCRYGGAPTRIEIGYLIEFQPKINNSTFYIIRCYEFIVGIILKSQKMLFWKKKSVCRWLLRGVHGFLLIFSFFAQLLHLRARFSLFCAWEIIFQITFDERTFSFSSVGHIIIIFLHYLEIWSIALFDHFDKR